jgi:hypothetical protein
VTPENRAKAIVEHFEDLPPKIRADLERVVASAIRRAVFHELRQVHRWVHPLFMKPTVTEKNKVKFDVYWKLDADIKTRMGKYATNATCDDPGVF